MTQVSQAEAIQAAEENYALHERLKRLEREEQRTNDPKGGEQLDTTYVDRLHSKNNALRDEIADLQAELAELRLTNVTELRHRYQRLESKRAYLTNENGGLRRILANQRKDVRRATNNANAYQEIRRKNDEENAAAKEDVKMFKERREALQKECAKLTRREARLQNELASMPPSHEELEAERRKLSEDNAKKGAMIEELEHQLAELKSEQEARQSHEEERRASAESLADVSELRREYVELKAQLSELKQV